MGDTRALQSATSHNLGQNFSKAFDIRFLDQNNQLSHAWTTSWGLSTRMIGAIIMTHGDDLGLVLPPKLAPFQVVIVPIYKTEDEKSMVLGVIDRLKAELKGFRVKVDDRPEVTPGYKFNHWELRGVPLRLEVGPKDIEKGSVMASRRDMPGKPGKTILSQENLAEQVGKLLDEIQVALFNRAKTFRDEHIFEPKNYGEMTEMLQNGWTYNWWCESKECEAKVKEDTKATIRNIPLDQPEGHDHCIVCGQPAKVKVYFSRAY
jgi:prolyl-tRNA synthetase